MNQKPRLIKIGTRASPLALVQANMVKDRLLQTHPALMVEIIPMSTAGDRVQDKTLGDIGGKGLFTKEIEDALLNDEVQLAVHSMKDMPTRLPDGLVIPCMLEREDPRDAFISAVAQSLDQLPHGAIIGTASLRRAAQIKHIRPDITLVPLRGNVQTRLRKLAEGQCDATLLAVAGLNRLGMQSHITAALDTTTMLPAVAQGAIGVECRVDDQATLTLLRPIHHAPTEIAVIAERAMLARLDGSCRTPIAGYATLDNGELHLDGLIAKPDGSILHRLQNTGRATLEGAAAQGHALGEALAKLAGADFLGTC